MLRVREVDEKGKDDQDVRPNRHALERRGSWSHQVRQSAGNGRPLRRVIVEAQRDLRRMP